nr:cobalt-precorrin-5B (C(1))-methyltransferase CbiD [uncultured Carboxylicivirga sp.]
MKQKAKILIFGGTTEGKKAAWLLDAIGESYIYSTKTNSNHTVKGKQVNGAMNSEDIVRFCTDYEIKMVIDAAHPFATELHQNILLATESMSIETIRFERTFADLSQNKKVRLFDCFEELSTAVCESQFNNILALTGTQTIDKLKAVWQQKNCIFRILPTQLSLDIALRSGIDQDKVIQGSPEKDVASFCKLMLHTKAELVLTKESGESGFFNEKLEAAKELGVPVWVVSKPTFEGYTYTVNSQKALQSLIYQLRRSILKEGTELKHGYTTGSCVTAAAKGAFLTLFDERPPQKVTIQIPKGEMVEFVTYCTLISPTEAVCSVIKNAGDDPDITHGEEVGCRISLQSKAGIQIKGGKGIGKVTLPGLAVPVGEAAINPVPRQMLTNILSYLKGEYEYDGGVLAEPFVTRGEELAEKTFNPRIGVIGGISILGTTGRVEPYSNEAFVASIKKQIQVAKALNCTSIVLTSGLRSENKMKTILPEQPQQAYIHFGNLVGDTLELCEQEGIEIAYIGLMIGKAIKLAEGHLNTHSKKVQFNADFASQLALKAGYSEQIIEQIKEFKLANAITGIIPLTNDEPFYKEVIALCKKHCKTRFKKEIQFYLLP